MSRTDSLLITWWLLWSGVLGIVTGILLARRVPASDLGLVLSGVGVFAILFGLLLQGLMLLLGLS